MKFINKQGLNEIFDEVYFNLDNVPIETIRFKNDTRKSKNGINFFSKGDLKEYILQPFKEVQPKTYEQLINGNFFYAIKRDPPLLDEDITQFGIYINNRAFYIKYFPRCYAVRPDYHEFTNVPEFILQSWFYRSDRWNVAKEVYTGIYKSRLPSTLKMPIHSIIAGFDDKKNIDNNSDFLTEKFNFEFRKNYEDDKYNIDFDNYFQLLCLLDTRNIDDFSESGFQLFLYAHLDRREIYIIKNADIYSIKKLDNAQDAIDSYGAHLFSGAEGEFDFWQYAVDF